MHTHSQIDDIMAQKSCSLNMHCIEDLSVGLYYLYHYLNTRSICLRLVVYIYIAILIVLMNQTNGYIHILN